MVDTASRDFVHARSSDEAVSAIPLGHGAEEGVLRDDPRESAVGDGDRNRQAAGDIGNHPADDVTALGAAQFGDFGSEAEDGDSGGAGGDGGCDLARKCIASQVALRVEKCVQHRIGAADFHRKQSLPQRPAILL